MKRIKHQVSKIIANITYKVAIKGAGLASDMSWYQPKVPDKLCK